MSQLRGFVGEVSPVAWQRAMQPRGRSTAGKVKLFLLSSVHPILDFLFFIYFLFYFGDILELRWTPDSHRITLICERLSKLVFFRGKVVENYSTTLLTSLLG